MNVFVRREQVSAGQFVIKKFSLCYPADINTTRGKYNHEWPLLDGLSWRTAVFQGATLGHARGMLETFEDALAATPALLKVVDVETLRYIMEAVRRRSVLTSCG